jgi:hypothetical protein
MPHDEYRSRNGASKALTIKPAGPFPVPGLELDRFPALAPGHHLHKQSPPTLLQARSPKNKPPGQSRIPQMIDAPEWISTYNRAVVIYQTVQTPATV